MDWLKIAFLVVYVTGGLALIVVAGYCERWIIKQRRRLGRDRRREQFDERRRNLFR